MTRGPTWSGGISGSVPAWTTGVTPPSWSRAGPYPVSCSQLLIAAPVPRPPTPARRAPARRAPARGSPAPDARASRPARRALRSQRTHPPRGLLQIPGSPPRWIRRGWTIQGRLSWSFRAPQRRLHSAARWRHHPRRWRGPVTALVADPVDGSAQVSGGVGMDEDNLTRVDPDAEDRVRLVAQRPAQAVEEIGVHRSTLPFRSPTRPRGPSRESRSSGGWG